MKVSQNFDIREFVPKEIYDAFGDNSIWFINPTLYAIAEFYKRFFKELFKADDVFIVINNWHLGGPHHFRGYRPITYTEGGKNSQHRLGNAFDCDILVVKDSKKTEVSYADVQQIIIKNQQQFFNVGVRAIEDTAIATTWLHTDCRPHREQKILIVKP